MHYFIRDDMLNKKKKCLVWLIVCCFFFINFLNYLVFNIKLTFYWYFYIFCPYRLLLEILLLFMCSVKYCEPAHIQIKGSLNLFSTYIFCFLILLYLTGISYLIVVLSLILRPWILTDKIVYWTNALHEHKTNNLKIKYLLFTHRFVFMTNFLQNSFLRGAATVRPQTECVWGKGLAVRRYDVHKKCSLFF